MLASIGFLFSCGWRRSRQCRDGAFVVLRQKGDGLSRTEANRLAGIAGDLHFGELSDQNVLVYDNAQNRFWSAVESEPLGEIQGDPPLSRATGEPAHEQTAILQTKPE